MAVQLFPLILFAVHFQEYLFLLICFVFVSFSYFFLIKSYNSSCHTVRKRGYLSSGSSRNVHGLSKYSVANLHKCLEILLFQIFHILRKRFTALHSSFFFSRFSAFLDRIHKMEETVIMIAR